jgi:hypothetical protein
MAVIDLEHVTRLADFLSPEEKQNVIEHLTRQLHQADEGARPESDGAEAKHDTLRGIWQGKFPEDFDIDAVLDEIRHEWEKELDEFGVE